MMREVIVNHFKNIRSCDKKISTGNHWKWNPDKQHLSVLVLFICDKSYFDTISRIISSKPTRGPAGVRMRIGRKFSHVEIAYYDQPIKNVIAFDFAPGRSWVKWTTCLVHWRDSEIIFFSNFFFSLRVYASE